MSRHADGPLTKITFNIYTKDAEFLREHFGQGYTEILRLEIHRYVERVKKGPTEEKL